ncbi:MAG: tape measure protein [Rhizobiaceae bacterium]
MPTKIDEAFVELRARDAGLEASLKRVATRLDDLDRKGGQNLANLDAALQRVRRSVLTMATAWGAWRVGRGIVEAGMQVEAMRNRMVAATGDSRIAGEALQFVREEANRLGLDIRDAANGFSGFAAAALRSGLTLQQTQEIFSGVSEAAVSMRLPAEQVALVFKALEQMAGKGTVSMEELRGQLGDALPGAFEIAARAMGKTTAEFSKMVANGEVMASEFLPRFGEAVRRELGGSVDEASRGAQAAFNRMGNAFFELRSKMAESGFLDAITDSVNQLTEAMNDPDTVNGLKGFAAMLGDIVTAATKAASAIGGFFAEAERRKAALNAASEGKSLFTGVGRGVSLRMFDPMAVMEDAEHTRDLRERVLADFEAKQKAIAAARGPQVSPNAGYTLGSVSKPVAGSSESKAAEKAARMREQLSGQVDSLRYQFADPEQQAAMDVEKQQELLREALEAKAITEQEFRELGLQAEMEYHDALKEIRDKAREEELTALEGFLETRIRSQAELNSASLAEQGASFGRSIDQAAKHNQVFFALEKARAMAAALISARESVVHAYNFGSRIGGPPLGAVFAGVAAAAQAANIAAIASTSYRSGGSGVSSAGGGGGGVSDMQGEGGGGYSANAPGKSVYITLNGNDAALFTKNQIRQLLDGINDAIGDGSQLKIAVAA